ncbi:MAG: PDZ domain-containing protein, partial [Desulfobacterales bacterium]
VITAAGGRDVTSKETYHSIIRDFGAGDIISLTALRDDKTRTFQVHSRTFPEQLTEDLAYKLLGVRVADISSASRLKFRIAAKDGVMVTEVRPGAYLDRIGARPGDVIRRINEVPVKTLNDFKRALIKYRQREFAALLIQRGNQQYYVTARTEA